MSQVRQKGGNRKTVKQVLDVGVDRRPTVTEGGMSIQFWRVVKLNVNALISGHNDRVVLCKLKRLFGITLP